MDILGLAIRAVAKLITTFIMLFLSLLHIIENGLRAPLDHVHLTGLPQTLAVAMVPFLSLVAAVQLMRGILRVIVVVALATFLGYVLLPPVLSLLP